MHCFTFLKVSWTYGSLYSLIISWIAFLLEDAQCSVSGSLLTKSSIALSFTGLSIPLDEVSWVNLTAISPFGTILLLTAVSFAFRSTSTKMETTSCILLEIIPGLVWEWNVWLTTGEDLFPFIKPSFHWSRCCQLPCFVSIVQCFLGLRIVIIVW